MLFSFNIRPFACIIVSGFILLGCRLLDACSFLMRKWRGVDLGEKEELGGVERKETVVRMYLLYERRIYFQ